MNKKRAFIYCRVSTTEQAEEGYSLSEQENRLKKYCEAMDWIIADVFIDGGYSGSTLDRPAMKEMIKQVEKHKTDVVLVDKLDRLSRSQSDTLNLIQKVFEPNDVAFVSRAESFDTSSAYGMAMVGILAAFAELERKKIRERMIEGKDGRAKEGKHRGGGLTAIGYDYDKESGILIINEYEAAQVREVFELFNNRTPLYTIAKMFNEKGYRTKYGKWRDRTVRNIVHNPVYIGKIKNRDNYYDGLHEPIVDKETFERSQAIIAERERVNEKYKIGLNYKSPLGGLCWCGKCGARYSWKSNGKNKDGTYRNYYRCGNKIINPRRNRTEKCNNKTYRDFVLNEIIFTEIRKLKTDPEYFNTIQDTSVETGSIELIEKHIEELAAQISKYMDLYSIGVIPIDDIKAKIEPLAEEKAQLEEQLENIEKTPVMANKDDIDGLVDLFNEAVESNQPNLINRVITELIDQIIINDDNIEIHWSFNPVEV